MRSITAKLILGFLVVSITGVALGAVISYWQTEREFRLLTVEQTRTRFAEEAVQYFEANGSWAGIETSPRFLPPVPRGPSLGAGAERPASTDRAPAAEPPRQGRVPLSFFGLADLDGRVIITAGDMHPGDVLASAVLAKGLAVVVGQERVGTVIDGETPPLGPLEIRYLDRTNRALLLAALGAAAVALLLGVVLARTLTHPLRDLTAATHAMARGQLRQSVRVTSSDEIGVLAAAFNEMSADLDRLNESRRQMIVDIAHDLRTPLTVIGGYIESMRDGILKPTQARLDLVGEEVQRLMRLVEDLRTLYQADSGELGLNREPLSIEPLLRHIAEAYQPLAAKQGIRLGVDVAGNLPRLNADPDRLAQVFGNLVTNSLRNTPEGGAITFRAWRDNGAVALAVRDTGQGISPEDLPRVFDRFYRAEKARSGTSESGLGLAIARSIVEAHGGTIAAESAVGQGTQIVLRLPAVTGTQTDSQAAPPNHGRV